MPIGASSSLESSSRKLRDGAIASERRQEFRCLVSLLKDMVHVVPVFAKSLDCISLGANGAIAPTSGGMNLG